MAEKLPKLDTSTVIQNIDETSNSIPLPDGQIIIRKFLLNSAVNFLNNPKLKNRPKTDLKSFLSGKGLTTDEIDLALQLSLVRPLNEANLQRELDLLAKNSNQSLLFRCWNILYQFILFGGFFYGAYCLYWQRIRPYLDGKSDQIRPEEEICQRIQQLQDQISELRRNVSVVHEFISTYCQLRDDSVGKMRKELSSIKALLVNKNQFPSVPSIPKWQLSSNKTSSHNSNN